MIMNRNQIKVIVIKGISDYSKVPEEKIKENHFLIKDLGFDSLDSVELIILIEEKFNIEIPDSDVNDLKTVKQVIDYIYKKILKTRLKREIKIVSYLKILQEASQKNIKGLIFTWKEGGPAKAMIPAYNKIRKSLSSKVSFKTYYNENEKNRDMFKRFSIRAVPTLIFLKNNIEIERFVGMESHERIIKKLKSLGI